MFYRYQQLLKQNKTPEQFWALDGTQWPHLQPVAQKIFSLISSSAACERNFSSMGFIHSKLRNRLSQNTIEKLVFVRSNRLISRGNHQDESSEEEIDEEVPEVSDDHPDI